MENIPTKAKGSPRQTMETSAAKGFKNASAEPSSNTKFVKKKGAQAGDPAPQAKPARSKVVATSGAAYGIKAVINAYKPSEAGLVQGNGKIIPAAVNRSRPNFNSGASE